jgi:xylan 1,4-beta-xylosidase
MGLKSELTDGDRGFALIASFPRFRSAPIIRKGADSAGCAACSSRVNPANNYRNSTLYPAYTAAAIKALFERQDRHAVSLASMLGWLLEFEDKDHFEGFRSLATNRHRFHHRFLPYRSSTGVFAFSNALFSK